MRLMFKIIFKIIDKRMNMEHNWNESGRRVWYYIGEKKLVFSSIILPNPRITIRSSV
jgi:hypothetical protein